jgi:hypothetical protein
MSDHQHYWHDLVAIALVGTDRRAELPAPPAALAPLLGQIAAPSAAAALLGAAAAASLYARAGSLPPAAASEAVAPCPDGDLATCGPRAARHLAALLDGRQDAILREWLAALAASGRRAPDAALPALLERARAEQELRPAVVATLGARGRWLAALNPDWRFAVEGAAAIGQDEAELAQLWQTGTRNGRAFMLKTLRASDPGRARALVESTWASEKADDRAAFVEALGTGLSMADEPFLEAALDDRAKDVRANAAALLGRLPDSRLAGRMAARAMELVTYRGGFLSKVEVRLPEEPDKSLQRDGVELQTRRGPGERSWWLIGILSRTPPATWGAAWSLAPAAILATRAPGEWRDALVKGWANAAVAYRDQEWAAALANLALKEPERVPLAEIAPLLPRAQREELLIRMLDGGRQQLTGTHPALRPLRATSEPWSHNLARSVIASLGRRFAARTQENPREDWALRQAFESFALSIPPDLAEEAIRALPPALEENPYWAPLVHSFAERLRLRRDMHIALREP